MMPTLCEELSRARNTCKTCHKLLSILTSEEIVFLVPVKHSVAFLGVILMSGRKWI